MPQPTRDKGVLTRRDALKTLAAITGAVTLASLPGKWVTPLVQVGALPAHAQCSIIPGTGSIEVNNQIGNTTDVDLVQANNTVRSGTLRDEESLCWTGLQPGDYDLHWSVQSQPCGMIGVSVVADTQTTVGLTGCT